MAQKIKCISPVPPYTRLVARWSKRRRQRRCGCIPPSPPPVRSRRRGCSEETAAEGRLGIFCLLAGLFHPYTGCIVLSRCCLYLLIACGCAFAQRGTGELRLAVEDAAGKPQFAPPPPGRPASHTPQRGGRPPRRRGGF